MPERHPNADPIPLTRLSELYGDWSFMVWCSLCGRRSIANAALARQNHEGLSLFDFCHGLRCSRPVSGGTHCRGEARRVELRKHQMHGKSSKIIREWTIWTAGARDPLNVSGS